MWIVTRPAEPGRPELPENPLLPSKPFDPAEPAAPTARATAAARAADTRHSVPNERDQRIGSVAAPRRFDHDVAATAASSATSAVFARRSVFAAPAIPRGSRRAHGGRSR